MRQHIHTSAHVDRVVQSVASEDRWKLLESQTIEYDAGAIRALVVGACGLEPERGAPGADRWRVRADRIFNHELDLLRAASGASAGQVVTFKPMDENAVARSADDPGR